MLVPAPAKLRSALLPISGELEALGFFERTVFFYSRVVVIVIRALDGVVGAGHTVTSRAAGVGDEMAIELATSRAVTSAQRAREARLRRSTEPTP